jgi:hypothetical protein
MQHGAMPLQLLPVLAPTVWGLESTTLAKRDSAYLSAAEPDESARMTALVEREGQALDR